MSKPARQPTLFDDLRALAWKPEEEDLAPKGPALRPAELGETFLLIVHRNPGGHKRPSKATKKPGPDGKPKMVRVAGLSVNDWMGADWRIRQNLMKALEKLVNEDVKEQACPAFTEGRPYVQVTYYFKARFNRDHMNYGKQVVDAIVRAGVLKDDNDKAIDLDRNRIVEGDKNPRVEVLLKDTRAPQTGA